MMSNIYVIGCLLPVWSGYMGCNQICIPIIHSYRISSKSRRTSKSCRPRSLAAPMRRLVPINAALEISPHGKGSSDSKYADCRRTRTICTIEMDECAGARRVSGLVATLKISPPSKFRHRVQRLEIKSRRGEISRKYGKCDQECIRKST